MTSGFSPNLLPPSRLRRLAVERWQPVVGLLALVAIISLGLVYAGALVSRLTIQSNMTKLTAQKKQAEPAVAQFDTVATAIKDLSASLTEYNNIVAKQRNWSILFTYIQNSLPPDAALTSINTANEQGNFTVTIAGSATDQKTVGVFREKLLNYAADTEKGQERVSQVSVDSIAQGSTGRQNFSLRATVDLSPKPPTK